MTKTEQELLEKINAIDTEALAIGGGKMADLFVLEKRAMWEKGMVILGIYPELSDGGAKAGRPKKEEKAIVSMNKVAIITGRSTPTISNWIKLVMVAGTTKTAFAKWAKDAKAAAVDKWQQKMLENKAEKKQKKIENELYLSMKEQIDLNSYEDDACKADIQLLFKYFKQFESNIRKTLMWLADGELDRARIELEKALNKMED